MAPSVFLLLFLGAFASSSSPPLSSCPFTLHANGNYTINKTDELKRRDVTPEQFDEQLAALVWCLPKTYNMEKPPFVGKIRNAIGPFAFAGVSFPQCILALCQASVFLPQRVRVAVAGCASGLGPHFIRKADQRCRDFKLVT